MITAQRNKHKPFDRDHFLLTGSLANLRNSLHLIRSIEKPDMHKLSGTVVDIQDAIWTLEEILGLHGQESKAS